MQCSPCPTISADQRQVCHLDMFRWIPPFARSPWTWPILPLVAIAAVGQWVGVMAAEEAAGACAAVVLGIAVGLTVAGRTEAPRQNPGASPRRTPTESLAPAAPAGSTRPHPKVHQNLQRAVDLRGARLVNTMLVRADLRQADLRGAVLSGADLSGADLTGARLGPLEEGPRDDEAT